MRALGIGAPGPSSPVHAAAERDDDAGGSRVQRAVAHLGDNGDLLRSGEADPCIDLDAIEGLRKFEHRHVRHRIGFRKERHLAHERARDERAAYRDAQRH